MGGIYIGSLSPRSGNITFANGYLMIQGNHYNLRDWYIRREAGDVSICSQDILSIDFIKMRSKMLLMIFIAYAFVMISFGKKIYKQSEAAFAVLVVGCLGIFLWYILKQYKFIRVSSAGCTVALETKYYPINQLEYMISCWNYMRYGNNQY